jgi:MerR family transcriptional regulator, heat shock protein HspR
MPHNENEPVYVISVAARLAGLPCWVLRVLDQEGIVVPCRTDSNRRLYSDADIVVLNRVFQLTKRGVNIEGVKVILEMEQERQDQERQESNLQNDLPLPRQD